MLNKVGSLTAAAVAIAAISSANASMPSFRGVGDLSGGQYRSQVTAVSANGQVVVGDSYSGLGGEAFRWEGGVMVGLGDLPGGPYGSDARGVSADASVIVGLGTDAINSNKGYRWENGVMTILPDAPGQFDSVPRGISGDGTVIVGFGESANGRRAVRWDNGVPTALPAGSDGSYAIEANAISTDGATIVGYADVPGIGGQAYRHTTADGLVPLRTTVVSDESSLAYGVSATGDFIVGRDEQAAGFISEGFRWENGTIMSLGSQTPDGRAVSADGSIVVLGSIWQQGIGVRSVSDVLMSDYGLDLSGWTGLNAVDISDDGTVIVGNGINPDGNPEGWIATIPEPASLTLLLLGLAIAKRRRGQC